MSSSQPASKIGRRVRFECDAGEKMTEKTGTSMSTSAADEKLPTPSHCTAEGRIELLHEEITRLATHLFKEPIKEPLRFIKIVLSNVDYRGEVFKCYVQVDNPGREPKMYSSGNETQSTREEALEVLRVALVKKIAAKHEEITARDKEVAARDKKKEQEWEVGRRRFNNATREETHDKYESPYS